MSPFIKKTSEAGAPHRALSHWSHALSLLHAIGCASGLIFFP